MALDKQLILKSILMLWVCRRSKCMKNVPQGKTLWGLQDNDKGIIITSAKAECHRGQCDQKRKIKDRRDSKKIVPCNCPCSLVNCVMDSILIAQVSSIVHERPKDTWWCFICMLLIRPIFWTKNNSSQNILLTIVYRLCVESVDHSCKTQPDCH